MQYVKPEITAAFVAELTEFSEEIPSDKVLAQMLSEIEISAKQGCFGKTFDEEVYLRQEIQEELHRRGFQVEMKSSKKMIVYWE